MSNHELVIDIGSRVWDAAKANGGNMWKAAEAVSKKLSKSERDQLLVRACIEAERYALGHARPVEGEGHSQDGVQSAIAEPLNRLRAILSAQNPLDYIVAVANTGERKRLGDLTQRDCQIQRRYYAVVRDTYADKERGWKSLEDAVPEGSTLRDVWSTLTKRHRDFLSSELGVKLDEDEGEAPPMAEAAD